MMFYFRKLCDVYCVLHAENHGKHELSNNANQDISMTLFPISFRRRQNDEHSDLLLV